MASAYSALKIELIATGEQSGTWGITTNVNLGTALEEAIVGRANAVFASDSDLTISLTDSNATQVARNYILNVTSGVSLSTTRNLIVPTINKPYIIENNTTGSQSIVVKTSSGTGVTVPNGRKVMVYADGTNVVSAFDFATLTGGTINNTVIGGVTPAAGTFTTLNSTGGALNGTVGATTPAAGTFTTLNSTGGALNGSLGATTPSTAVVTSLTNSGLTSGRVTFASTGGLLADSANLAWNGTTLAVTGAFSATADSSFTSTGALTISKGTTGERPTPVSGMLRFNTTSTEFEGYNGTAWASVGGAALTNDTATTTNLFPLFSNATSGTASTLFTSNAKYLYKPSTGELQASVLNASNGIVVNSQTVAASYSIPSGSSAMSTGPVTVASGVTVDIPSGSKWVVL
jgi:hypothetical protein